jgi:hypothetical protein
VAGGGILSPKYTGLAPESTLINAFFSEILLNAKEYADKYNMVITNNSYGSETSCDYSGNYDAWSQWADQIALDIPVLSNVFAAGNSGDEQCNNYPQHYGTIFDGKTAAKNPIIVGRTDYNQVPSGSSSSGPAKDGRLKPDITALGIITSANAAGDGYFDSYGTSMSAPVVSGGLALLYQRYRQMHNDQNPSSALAKAILLNGARDVFTPGPDYRTGFGTMMINRSLRILDNGWHYEDSLAQDESRTVTINVPPNQTQLKALLYWNDLPGSELALNSLVNDLDIEVHSSSGEVFYPLITDANAVEKPAAPGIDRINNAEQVVISFPMSGQYEIMVKNHFTMGGGKQSFALAWDYFPAAIEIIAPYGGEVVSGTGISEGLGGRSNFPITWEDEGYSSGTYTLEFSSNNGQAWNQIVTGLKDTCRMFWWIPPAKLISNETFIRITKSSVPEAILSGKFSLLPYVNFSLAPINEQCPGYMKLKWTNAINADSIDGYEILLKKGPKMEPIAQVSADTYEYAIKNLREDETELCSRCSDKKWCTRYL